MVFGNIEFQKRIPKILTDFFKASSKAARVMKKGMNDTFHIFIENLFCDRGIERHEKKILSCCLRMQIIY